MDQAKNNKEIKRFFNNSKDNTSKASTNVRNLAFAGIAIVWLFKSSDPEKPIIPDELIFPLILFCLALTFDFIQYVWAGFIWLYKAKKSEKMNSICRDYEVTLSSKIPNSIHIIYWLKVVTIVVSYILLATYLSSIIVK